MSNLKNKDWWYASLVRAIRTTAQTAVSVIGTTAMLSAVDWRVVASSAVLAGIVSLLTSLGGLPEVQKEQDDSQA